MKEFILVEFMVELANIDTFFEKIRLLEDDFEIIKNDTEWDSDEEPIPSHSVYRHVSGRMNSMTASVLKLRDSFLAERMRVSYIPDNLKDKYRK